jgi:hypothetical protein
MVTTNAHGNNDGDDDDDDDADVDDNAPKEHGNEKG